LLKFSYSKLGELVFDATMGTGSTGVAAIELKRRFVGCDKDKTVFDLAIKRIYESASHILKTSNFIEINK
jgi:DNA modification methylase